MYCSEDFLFYYHIFYFVVVDFKIENNKLVYVPLNLIVVPDDERDALSLKICKKFKTDVGEGISMFYSRVRDKYLKHKKL
jgi:hypothetical protein